ncbi:hypothetical protein MMC13_007315 [Lambiella insularis]|nr:hypothetical protein [Lambiella insularis]
MNSSTLRRLASDHASLYKVDLPPYYLFPSGAASMPEDLTQLTLLITGPPSTPYAAGLWKLHLKIPLDYPKSAPKASFRTKLWHPNVEESTGSVCVETLKRDWQPKLTLRDILITISCLLINPNPDSALNASAGKLLQEDYGAFSRQARLMTSIHAPIPTSLREAVTAAKTRGDNVESAPPKPNTKKRPHLALEAPTPPSSAPLDQDMSPSDDEASASKENDPTLSPIPVNPPHPSARRPLLSKRPLSDLPTPTETDSDNEEETCTGLTPSERNIAANTPNLSSNIAAMAVSEERGTCSNLAERSRSFIYTSRGKDEGPSGLMIMPFEDKALHNATMNQEEETSQPSAKRICSGEEKENMSEVKPIRPVVECKPSSMSGKPSTSVDMRKVSSARGSSGGGSMRVMAKPRVGLRRL